ncbi:MAG: electron transfer flavoprotein-ubiquinone oxidoreductase [Gemmatimonadetes bacterium]|nr:electron transfer flavoprotein-ubiquinone oxidoreductase [Gemmatimonadota bacterium]
MSTSFVPARFQPALPKDRLILAEKPADDRIDLDVVFVGAGPAGLAGAIELARLVKHDNESRNGLGEIGIGVLEKAAALGEHSLSGAVVNPRAFHELFPGMADPDFPFRGLVTKESVCVLTQGGHVRIPTPPTMHNKGFYVASLCEIVRWLGEKAEQAGVNLFPGYPADSLLVDGPRVAGVRTTPSGLGRDRQPASGYRPPTDVAARVTVLTEGTRGPLAQAYLEWQNIGSPNPQIFALGVKEIWETKRPLDRVIHTMGWPLPADAFGGSFLYPLEPNVLALGLVAGLDCPDPDFDVHETLQRMKLHPLFRKYLEGGEMVEWGAKTIPEGGFYSLPTRRSGDGVLIAGDAAGFVDVPSLKGVHYAMQSGMFAARAIFRALKANDCSATQLGEYDRRVNESFITKDLYRTRNMRLAFKDGFYVGGVKAGLMTLTGGAFPGGKISMHRDADVPRQGAAAHPLIRSSAPNNKLTFSKVDAVFKSGNATRDTIPSHLIVGQDVPEDVARMYAHLCPAGVYELVDGKLKVNPPNCVDCKATDVLGPRWTPREGGSGPRYKRM